MAQDSWAACEYMGDTGTLFLGVFDGHGQEGAKASNAGGVVPSQNDQRQSILSR